MPLHVIPPFTGSPWGDARAMQMRVTGLRGWKIDLALGSSFLLWRVEGEHIHCEGEAMQAAVELRYVGVVVRE